MHFSTLNQSVTTTEFKLLFTPGERVAAREYAKTDAVVADMFDLLDDQRTLAINLTMPQIGAMLEYLVQLSVLTPERKQQILSAEIPDNEISVVLPVPNTIADSTADSIVDPVVDTNNDTDPTVVDNPPPAE
jgi:hypothetical protein